jgi:hypothetical protein
MPCLQLSSRPDGFVSRPHPPTKIMVTGSSAWPVAVLRLRTRCTLRRQVMMDMFFIIVDFFLCLIIPVIQNISLNVKIVSSI